MSGMKSPPDVAFTFSELESTHANCDSTGLGPEYFVAQDAEPSARVGSTGSSDALEPVRTRNCVPHDGPVTAAAL